jgi:hypothetical protein
MANEKGCILAAWWDESDERPRVAVGYVGENGIKPETLYRVVKGEFVEVPA